MKQTRRAALWLDVQDNVATVLESLSPGDELVVEAGSKAITIVIAEHVPFGHKVALTDLEPGERVIKYGEAIGQTVASVQRGAHVHVHNCVSLRGVAK